MLKLQRVAHSFVEFPGAKPDLYHMLFGEQKAPKGYLYLAERAQNPSYGQPADPPVWSDGIMEWLPLPPSRPVDFWKQEHTEHMLTLLNHSVAVMDMGSAWNIESCRDLCLQSVMILLVCGPSPVHLGRLEASHTWMKLNKLMSEGANVQLVANRNVPFRGREEWLKSLPAEPLCLIPELPAKEVLSSLWNGELVPDCAALKPVIAGSLKPAADRICNNLTVQSKKRSPLGRLRQSLGL